MEVTFPNNFVLSFYVIFATADTNRIKAIYSHTSECWICVFTAKLKSSIMEILSSQENVYSSSKTQLKWEIKLCKFIAIFNLDCIDCFTKSEIFWINPTFATIVAPIGLSWSGRLHSKHLTWIWKQVQCLFHFLLPFKRVYTIVTLYWQLYTVNARYLELG